MPAFDVFDVFDAPLTNAEVQAGALPGESWKQARDRLESERRVDQWPVLVVDDPRPAYLRSLDTRPRRMPTSQSFAVWQAEREAEKNLTPRERFNRRHPDLYWPTYAELVAEFSAVERDWKACAECLPDWRDRALRYWVHTAYDQRLTVCSYVRDGTWSRVSDGSLFSGARHWRIACDDAPGSRVVTRAECYALARLSRLHKLPPFEDVPDEHDVWPWHIHRKGISK